MRAKYNKNYKIRERMHRARNSKENDIKNARPVPEHKPNAHYSREYRQLKRDRRTQETSDEAE